MMHRYRFILVALLVFTGVTVADEKRPPNIVIIMADDMGYAGLSCYGLQRHKTPHLDKLAAEGLRFTDFHSNGAVCSPTRAALLTGRYQQRTGVDSVVNADRKHPDHGQHLKPSEHTFAELLKTRGYATAIMGKWHVGYAVDHNPTHHGFDTFRGFVSGNIDYISHYDRVEIFDWWHDREFDKEQGYVTHLINKHALDFIETNKDKPFCLYIAHEAIHNPNQGPNDPAIRGPNKKPRKDLQPTLDAVRAMTLAMDDGVGQIVAKLRELDLDDNTLVWFFSDNGGTRENLTTGPLLRGSKGSVWEGGHRVPAIAWWPGRIKPGKVTDATVMTMDVAPTIAKLAGVTAPDSYKPDGIDVSGVLLRGEALPERTLFWKHGSAMAVRDGQWKLVTNQKSRAPGGGLYHLGNDLKESNDLSKTEAARAKAMRAKLDAWLKDVTGGAE